jgi:hypothetical protein
MLVALFFNYSYVADKFSTSNSSKDSHAVLRWAKGLLFDDQAQQNVSFFIRHQTEGFLKVLDFVQKVVQVSVPGAFQHFDYCLLIPICVSHENFLSNNQFCFRADW